MNIEDLKRVLRAAAHFLASKMSKLKRPSAQRFKGLLRSTIDGVCLSRHSFREILINFI